MAIKENYFYIRHWLICFPIISDISMELFFPDIKKHIPDNTDLSLWKVKDMQWIKDCPVPADEEFKRVAELWEVE